MKKETSKWLAIAKEDKEMAEITWKSKRYIYALMFWQQTVEKTIKAYIIEKIGVLPKRTHEIDELLKQAKLNISELKYKHVKELSLAFIRTRYDDLSRQYYAKKSIVEPLIIQAQKIFIWIEKKLISQ